MYMYTHKHIHMNPWIPIGDNGVHASASPFEALAERMNWLKVEPEKVCMCVFMYIFKYVHVYAYGRCEWRGSKWGQCGYLCILCVNVLVTYIWIRLNQSMKRCRYTSLYWWIGKYLYECADVWMNWLRIEPERACKNKEHEDMYSYMHMNMNVRRAREAAVVCVSIYVYMKDLDKGRRWKGKGIYR